MLPRPAPTCSRSSLASTTCGRGARARDEAVGGRRGLGRRGHHPHRHRRRVLDRRNGAGCFQCRASLSELRFLTVKNTGGADKAFAIQSAANPFRLTHVTAAASGGASYSRALVIDSGATTL